MEQFQGIISQIDPTILKIVIVVLIVMAVVSIIKRLIKLAVTIAIIGIIASCLLPAVSEVREKYQFHIEGNKAIIIVDEREITLDPDTLKNCKIEKSEDTGLYSILIQMDDGTSVSVEMPEFSAKAIEKYVKSTLKKAGKTLSEIDSD